MVNRLKMANVQAIQVLARQGWSGRRIARELGLDRQTVRHYLRTGGADDSKPANAPTGSQGVCAGIEGSDLPPIPACGDLTVVTGPGRPSAAAAYRAVILEKLQQGLDAQRIYQDLTGPEHGYQGSYYNVRRLAARLSSAGELPVRRMECDPGVEAQVDFGRGAWLTDVSGRRRGTWVFRIVLSHSRKGYSEAVLRQTTDDFLRCMENAFYDFGGVPRTLVIDNLRAAVSQADWFDPELCPKVRSFAEHYGVAILPTRPYTPQHKGKIESGVKYVKNNALKARTFATLAQQNGHLRHWEQTVADTRIHGTTRHQVLAVFAEVEKSVLQPLPPARFDLFEEALRQVHRDGHIQVKGAYYSVGPEYMGQAVWARWDGRMVRIFDSRMAPIALHAQVPPGQFSTQNRHIAPEKISRIERGASWLLQQAEAIGPEAGQWAQKMLQARGIAGMRVLMGLLSLKRQFATTQINQACQAAAEHGEYHLRCLRRLAQQRQAGREIPRQGRLGFIQEHPVIRPLADYAQFIRDAISGQKSAGEVQ